MLPKFRVTVLFSGWHDVYIKAASPEEAKDKVEELISSGDLEPDRTTYYDQQVDEAELRAEGTWQE